MSTEEEYEQLKAMKEPTDPNAKIPWCNLGYTVQQSKEICPMGGCWKYRCYDSKLHAGWSKKRAAWQEERRKKWQQAQDQEGEHGN